MYFHQSLKNRELRLQQKFLDQSNHQFCSGSDLSCHKLVWISDKFQSPICGNKWKFQVYGMVVKLNLQIAKPPHAFFLHYYLECSEIYFDDKISSLSFIIWIWLKYQGFTAVHDHEFIFYLQMCKETCIHTFKYNYYV